LRYPAWQERSVLGRARLVDYEPALTVSAGTVLQFEVGGSVSSNPHGLAEFAPGADGPPIRHPPTPVAIDKLSFIRDLIGHECPDRHPSVAAL
jgi:hypothetical protein